MISPRRSEIFVEAAGQLCEGPYWDVRTERLYWVDIPAGVVRCAATSGDQCDSWDLGTPVGAVARRATGGWVAALARGFARYDDDWSLDGPVIGIDGQTPGTRLNDGAVDPQGRFWAGTLDETGAVGRCGLYRLDATTKVVQVLDGVTTSNGIGWSPNGAIMYYVDTGIRQVDRITFGAEPDRPIRRERLVRVADGDGCPDGLAVDTTGCIWVALWGAGKVRRYTPTGRLDRELSLPVSQVSSVAFGNADASSLFVTTAAHGLDAAALAREPLAGSIFVFDTDVAGIAASAFAG